MGRCWFIFLRSRKRMHTRPMSRERRPSFVGEAGSRTGSRAGSRPGGSRGWRISRSMIRAASPTLKSGDEAALAALRVPPAQRSVEEHAAVRRWSERSVRLPGRTTHEELCTVMTLEEHPPHSLLFRQGTPGDDAVVRRVAADRPSQRHARPCGHACSCLTAVNCREEPPAAQGRPSRVEAQIH